MIKHCTRHSGQKEAAIHNVQLRGSTIRVNFLAVNIPRSCKTIFFCILSIICLLGCGKKGDPRAPATITPTKIKDLKALPRGKTIDLSWSIPYHYTDGSRLLDLKGFKILRSEISFDKFCAGCPKRFPVLYDIDYQTYMMSKPQSTMIEYTDRALHAKNVYTYRIVSYTSENQLSPKSNEQELSWDVSSLPPRELQAEVKRKSVLLTWKEPDALEDGTPLEGIVGYNLYRRSPGGVYTGIPVNDKPVTTLACKDNGIEPDKNYLYTLRAVRKVRETFIESEGSEEVAINTTDRTPLGAPTGLIAIPLKTGMTLKWDENKEPGLEGYNLYRKAKGEDEFEKLNSAPLLRASYLDNALKDREFYTYIVTAIDDATQPNESKPSQKVVIQYRY